MTLKYLYMTPCMRIPARLSVLRLRLSTCRWFEISEQKSRFGKGARMPKRPKYAMFEVPGSRNHALEGFWDPKP